MLHKTLNLHKLYGCSLSTTHMLQKNRQSGSQKCENSSSNSLITPNNVLSKLNKERCISLLATSRTSDVHKTKTLKKAAVLVPLCEINDHLAFLYTVRAFHLKVNGGQVAFPGGMVDKSDGTLEATALREANEEVGIVPSEVEVWGKGPGINRFDVNVTPVLGYLGQINPETLNINHDEVSSIFVVSLEDLSNSQKFRITKFRLGNNYIYQTPVYLGGRERIWGLTAYISHIVLSALIPEHYNKNIQYQPVLKKILFKKIK